MRALVKLYAGIELYNSATGTEIFRAVEKVTSMVDILLAMMGKLIPQGAVRDKMQHWKFEVKPRERLDKKLKRIS